VTGTTSGVDKPRRSCKVTPVGPRGPAPPHEGSETITDPKPSGGDQRTPDKVDSDDRDQREREQGED